MADDQRGGTSGYSEVCPNQPARLGVWLVDAQMLPGSGCQSVIFLESDKKSVAPLVRQPFSAKSQLVRNAG